jgi:hypothetical protein
MSWTVTTAQHPAKDDPYTVEVTRPGDHVPILSEPVESANLRVYLLMYAYDPNGDPHSTTKDDWTLPRTNTEDREMPVTVLAISDNEIKGEESTTVRDGHG